MHRRLIGLTTLCGLMLSFCAPHKVRDQIEPPSITPGAFSQSGQATLPDQWWRAFEDSSLDALVERGLTDNLGLRGAWARLRQFETLAIQAGAPLWPEVNASAAARRGKTVFFNQSQTADQFNLGLNASYEIDLWRRLSSLERAAALDWAASGEDLQAIALTLTANIARSWYGIVEQRELLTLLEQQIQTNRNFLEIIEARFANGLATAVEVYQQREQLAATRAQVPDARARLETLEHQLAALLGEPAVDAAAPPRDHLPQLPALPDAGLPVDLLRHRPDLRRAQNQLVAADYRLAAAVAAQYPSLRLTGDASFQNNALEELFDDWVWNLAANLLQPVFDKGRRQAEADRNRAVVAERLAGFENALLNAILEVEDALARERLQREAIERLAFQLQQAEAALRAGRDRYLRGIGDYLTVLAETQAVQRAQRTLIAARGALIVNRIALNQALGGGAWTSQLPQPDLIRSGAPNP